MLIQYYKRSVYGRTEIIPTGEYADAIKTLTRRKTLTRDDVQALATLGHKFELVSNPN